MLPGMWRVTGLQDPLLPPPPPHLPAGSLPALRLPPIHFSPSFNLGSSVHLFFSTVTQLSPLVWWHFFSIFIGGCFTCFSRIMNIVVTQAYLGLSPVTETTDHLAQYSHLTLYSGLQAQRVRFSLDAQSSKGIVRSATVQGLCMYRASAQREAPVARDS